MPSDKLEKSVLHYLSSPTHLPEGGGDDGIRTLWVLYDCVTARGPQV